MDKPTTPTDINVRLAQLSDRIQLCLRDFTSVQNELWKIKEEMNKK